jgi:hypothetical protein
MIIGGYAGGLLVGDRLYRVVKSKLYTIPWCAAAAGRARVALARWRWKHTVHPSPVDPCCGPSSQGNRIQASACLSLGELYSSTGSRTASHDRIAGLQRDYGRRAVICSQMYIGGAAIAAADVLGRAPAGC